MRRILDKLYEIIPAYSLFPLVFSFTFNMFVYVGSRMIAGEWHHYNIESSLDRLIPFWPPAAVIYLGCYLFWAVNYILIARQDREEVCRLFSADFLSRIVCLLFFLLIPTTNTRPTVEADGFWNQVMTLVYSIDAADNLFPSIHCLVSWFCYIGIRGKKEFPAWYRGCSLVMAVLICLSTVLTKQHVLVDVAGGVLLAELCFWAGKKPMVYGVYEKVLDRIHVGGNK